jgi:hypothetical protein
VIDGEAVLLGVDGVSDFNGLHSRKRNEDTRFCIDASWAFRLGLEAVDR